MNDPQPAESWVVNLDGGQAPYLAKVVAITDEHVDLHVVVFHNAGSHQRYGRERIRFVRQAVYEPEPVGTTPRQLGPSAGIVSSMMERIRSRSPEVRSSNTNEDADAPTT